MSNIVKIAIIKKLPNGKYQVQSHKGKNLGTYTSKEKAKERLRQVEFFKHRDQSHIDDKDNKFIDLTDIDDFSFSAIMRKLRKRTSKDIVRKFLEIYKHEFDSAISEQLEAPDRIALQKSLIKFNKINKIKLDKNIIKNAAITELGNPEIIGKYISDIVKFIMNRISAENRAHSLENLKRKIYALNENELASKTMPASSAMGQSITFIKHILFNHDPGYVRKVINNIVKNL